MKLTPESERQLYLEDNEDYGKDVVRVTDVESLDCWYGYIYTQNNSPYRLKETLKPILTGLDIVHPANSQNQDGELELDIPAGKDHVVILRRNQAACQYGLEYLTHPRELEEDEMIAIAKEQDANPFGESRVFYKLYNTANGAIFYFENQERDKKFSCEFEMQMENLYICDEPQGATTFKFKLNPGANCVKMLKPVDPNEGTGLQMSFSFNFEQV